MAVRSYNGRQLLDSFNRTFESTPGGVATTSNGRWINGTAGGDAGASNNTYKWGINSTNSSGSFAAIFDSSTSFSGATSMKVSTTAIASNGVVSTTLGNTLAQMIVGGIQVKPLATYAFSCRMKTNYVSGDSANGAYMQVTARTYDGTSIVSATTTNVKTTTGWTLYSGTITVPNNAYWISPLLFVRGSTGTGTLIMDAWFDDISLTEVITRTTTTSRTLASNRVLTRDMGTALSFDGVTNKVVLPTAINTVLSKAAAEFSVEYTFKAPDVTSLTVLFSSTIDTNDRFAISFGSGTVRIGVYNGVSWNTGSGSMPVVANQWYTISLRAVAGIITQAMLNGIAKSRTGGSNPITATTAGVVIGAKTDSTSFSKHIGDQLRIWNRAITDTEMQNSYFSNAVTRTGLVGEWLFNETTGTTALDSSGNGNNGTITGATYTTDTALRARSLA